MVLVQCLGSRSSSETWKEAPIVIQVRDDGGTDQGRGSGGGEKWLNSRYIWHLEVVRPGDGTLDEDYERCK